MPKQIGIALLLGILAGYAFYMLGIPEFTTNYLKPFGTIFVNLLKFIVVPVVLLSMIDGIISMGDMKKVGSVGWKTVAYFLVTTAAACVIGPVFANLFNNAGWFPTLALEDGAVWDKATSANFMDTPGRHLPEQHVEILHRRKHAAGHRDRPDVRRRHPCRGRKRASLPRTWSPRSMRSSSA